MSSSTHFNSNKENALKSQALLKGRQQALANQKMTNARDSGNNSGIVRSNKDRGEKARPGVQRVPLGGKDQNQSIPTLSRSKSSLNSIADNKQRKKILLPVKPSLSKSKSSLGFIHNDDSNSKPSGVENDTSEMGMRNDQPFGKRDELSPTKAFRSVDIVDSFTDTLEKQTPIQTQHKEEQETSISLKETLSPQTDQLHVSNLQDDSLDNCNVDPIKRSPKRPHSSKDDFTSNKFSKTHSNMQPFVIPEDLIEDPESIEYVPQKETPLPYIPIGIDPLTDNDLQFFSNNGTGVRIKADSSETARINESISSDDFDVNLDFTRESFDEYEAGPDKRESKNENNPGLTIDELNDLIDF